MKLITVITAKLSLLFVAFNTFAGPEIQVFTIPGLNRGGNYTQDADRLLGANLKVTEVQIPAQKKADLGQVNCQAYLRRTYHESTGNIIALATCQGTATIMNFLPQDRERGCMISMDSIENIK